MRNGFASHLSRYGPDARYPTPTLSQARSYCRKLTLAHYENFSVASLLLPRRLIAHFHAIYAYCRWADDLADETEGGEVALQLLAWWRDELQHCLQGQARHPVMIALAPTVRRFAIPPQPFLDLVDAFEQDQHVKRYDTYEQLLDYCRRSANPVGRLMLYLGKCHDEERGLLSDRICTALQLANFWQDVSRDLDIGRVYLPEEDRRRFGYADDDLVSRKFTPAFASLMQFEVERTRTLFLEGLPLVKRMPVDLQTDIELFARGGLAILDKIAAGGYNVWRERPRLTKWEKATLVVRTLLQKWRRGWQ